MANDRSHVHCWRLVEAVDHHWWHTDAHYNVVWLARERIATGIVKSLFGSVRVAFGRLQDKQDLWLLIGNKNEVKLCAILSSWSYYFWPKYALYCLRKSISGERTSTAKFAWTKLLSNSALSHGLGHTHPAHVETSPRATTEFTQLTVI